MKTLPILAGLLLLAIPAGQSEEASAPANTVRFDFETGDLQGWSIVEGAFGKFVCDRARFHNTGKPYNKQGKYFLSSLETQKDRPNDRFTGIAESPVFLLESPEISLLVGGGNHPDTYVAICSIDGKEHLRARGANMETMRAVQWKATGLVGQKVFLRLVDHHRTGWGHVTLDAVSARGRIDPDGTKQLRLGRQRQRKLRDLRSLIKNLNLAATHSAIEDLGRTYPVKYPQAADFLHELTSYQNRLDRIEQALVSGPVSDKAVSSLHRVLEEARAFQRRTLLANPLIKKYPILFCVRAQFKRGHHNTETMCHLDSTNGALKTIDFGRGGKITTLVSVPNGVARDMDVHFSGRKFVFSMRKDRADNHSIYEVNADGSGLRQLTSARGPQLHDIDPFYLPDDSIVFSSTREPKFCGCNQHIMCDLYRASPDGANIHQISKNPLHDGHGSLLPDGRILYDRWEYVDRNFGDAQGLWAVNPDGTNHAIYWGNHTGSPGAVLDGRAVPGTSQILCTFSSCHDRPWGAIALLDPRLATDGPEAVAQTWPPSARDLVNVKGSFDTFKRLRIKYEDPFPLSARYFLCSRMIGKGEQTGVYLIDVFGNELLLHTEGPGCFDPMPLGPRPRPPVLPSIRDKSSASGYCFVSDVYRGTGMEGVPHGTAKFLRVVEAPEKKFFTSPAWRGQGVEKPAMNWRNFENKRILGTVPVESDGSAYFQVPADSFIFFQLLDRDKKMIQSMRSGTVVQPGETIGCTGCHTARSSSPRPIASLSLLAARRSPSKLDGWFGPPRLFSYAAEVQPVFDRHCVRCHDFGKDAGRDLNLSGDRNPFFNASYIDLWRNRVRHFIKCAGAGPASVLPAYSWGSHASRLSEIAHSRHQGLALSQEEIERIDTWLDLNAPYYPTYTSAYPRNPVGRSPLNARQLRRLQELTGIDFNALGGSQRRLGPQISFERPEVSPCLNGLEKNDAARYQEALSIIQAGKDTLTRLPRADMPGHRPCPADLQRSAYYASRKRLELRNRTALCNGGLEYER